MSKTTCLTNCVETSFGGYLSLVGFLPRQLIPGWSMLIIISLTGVTAGVFGRLFGVWISVLNGNFLYGDCFGMQSRFEQICLVEEFLYCLHVLYAIMKPSQLSIYSGIVFLANTYGMLLFWELMQKGCPIFPYGNGFRNMCSYLQVMTFRLMIDLLNLSLSYGLFGFIVMMLFSKIILPIQVRSWH